MEVWVLEDSPQDSSVDSVFGYEVIAEEPGTELHVHILSCQDLNGLVSVDPGGQMGARAQINFRNPVAGVCNGAPQYELFWVNRSGGESRYGSRPCTGHTRSTYVGHLWVWRRAMPQPVETYVEDCSTDAELPKWAFASYDFSGFTVNIACALPEPSRIFSVDYFDQRLARVAELFPAHALPVLRTVTTWVFSDALIGGQTQCADYYEKRPGSSRSAGIPESVSGGIRWNGSFCPSSRRAAGKGSDVIHELAHAWDDLAYNPGDQYVYTSGTRQCPVTAWMPPNTPTSDYSSSMLGMVNCENESPVTDAYFNARATGLHLDSYASWNHAEYFAVLSEAWFASGYFSPHTRDELLDYDPVGAAAVEDAWNIIP